MPDARHWLVRRRVSIGFLAGAVVLVLAQPTWPSWRLGLLVALAGEALRLWASGHLEKSREVTQSGPYRFTRHPLYLGSTVVAVGATVAANSLAVAMIAFAYIAATIPAAIRAEETYLRRTFGETYDLYQARSPGRSSSTDRRFSFERARRNREHRAVAGLIAGFALLALKTWW